MLERTDAAGMCDTQYHNPGDGHLNAKYRQRYILRTGYRGFSLFFPVTGCKKINLHRLKPVNKKSF